MAADPVFKWGNLAHRTLIALSRGRIGWRAGKMPVLRLTTMGRSTGRPRSVMLTTPHRDGDTIAVVASKGGHNRDPDWLRNLQQQSAVEVTFQGGPMQRMTARVVGPSERPHLWSAITDKHPRYAAYQRKTTREIPIVLLEPND